MGKRQTRTRLHNSNNSVHLSAFSLQKASIFCERFWKKSIMTRFPFRGAFHSTPKVAQARNIGTEVTR